ncbi:EAL domain-containing protein [Porphyrobacter sp. GA68]|uniref:EAL domain-containing protein n=1 Tax=Porphyrobacter sp. GA68 TaxID=2883480 RepID=UPI001D18BD3C|nr:EAL domain-containing protein [Porphyrobacter sp. GA68]
MTLIDHRAFESSAGRGWNKCGGCREGQALPFAFTMAFQPIVDLTHGTIWGYEALVRGEAGEPARAILDQVDAATIYAFDQACRIRAIELFAALSPPGSTAMLSINFKPNAVYEPAACIRATLEAAKRSGFDRTRLMFEFTEDERMQDVAHVRRIVEAYRSFGFMTALDDFGAGYAGLSLLSDMTPDLIKLDMSLLRGIDASPARQAIVRSIVAMTRELGVACLAEGLETAAEVETIRTLGIALVQGFYFAAPVTGMLPPVSVGLLADGATQDAAG